MKMEKFVAHVTKIVFNVKEIHKIVLYVSRINFSYKIQ
jgi:hypothetical protein